MTRQLTDIVGHLFPTTQAGSYPRPRWNGYDLGGEDIRVALRRAGFAEAFSDGVRAMIGDQVDAGIDIPTDGHLWYDRHEGLISSFLLYPAYHLSGIEVLPEANPLIMRQDAAAAAFGNTWNNVVVTGQVGRGSMHLAQLWRSAQAVSAKTVKFCSGMGPANLGAWLTDLHYRDKAALYRDLADAYNAEFKDAVAAGVRIFQLDDVAFTLHGPEDYPLVVDTLNRALDGVDAFRIFHICHLGSGAPVGITPYASFHELVAGELQVDAVEYAFAETGFPDADFALWSKYPSEKGLGVGVIDIKRLVVETPEQIVAGVRKALRHVPPERIHLTTDCGSSPCRGRSPAGSWPRWRRRRSSSAARSAEGGRQRGCAATGHPTVPKEPGLAPRAPASVPGATRLLELLGDDGSWLAAAGEAQAREPC